MTSISSQGKALFAWNGSEWIPLNGGTNFSTIQRWSKIFEGGETSISGNDSEENLLIYTPGYEQVYLNGILLVRNEDYTATDGVEINLSSPLSEDDILDIIIFIPLNIGNTYTRQQSDAKFSTVEEFNFLSASVQNIDFSPYLTIEDAEDIYLDIESASATYLDIISASTTYATIEDLNNLDALPTQTDQNGKYLTTDGTSASWATLDLSTKADKLITTESKNASYSLVLSDADKMIEMNVGSANNLTVPLNSAHAFPLGTQINILQTGTGQTTIVATGGVTINATPGLKLRTQWSSATLIKRATNTWVAIGDLVS